MKRFKLVDLIKLSGVELSNCKFHLATENIEDPLEWYFDGDFKLYQERQRQRNFQCAQIVSLISIGKNHWLFVGVFTVNDVVQNLYKGEEGWKYDTEEIDGLEHMIGRTVVYFERPGRNAYLSQEFAGQFEVLSIEESRLTEVHCRL